MKDDKTFELLTQMYAEFSKRFDAIDRRFDEHDRRFDEHNQRFEGIEGKLTKGLITQEKMSKDIKRIVEVQQNHMEQNERQHRKMMDKLNEKTTLLEGAIKHIAKRTINL